MQPNLKKNKIYVYLSHNVEIVVFQQHTLINLRKTYKKKKNRISNMSNPMCTNNPYPSTVLCMNEYKNCFSHIFFACFGQLLHMRWIINYAALYSLMAVERNNLWPFCTEDASA